MGKIREEILERNQKIKDSYNKKVSEGIKPETIMDELSKEHGVVKFYIRSILKEQGIIIERKTEYERTDKTKLDTRDTEIVELFNKDTDPDVIADKFNITPTRVRQILRSKLGKTFKASSHKLTIELEAIKKDLKENLPYKSIVAKYGKNTIKQIKYNLGFNLFKESSSLKTKDIIEMANKGLPPKDIAAKHGVTRNYVYIILHDNGIRYNIKDDKIARDKKIIAQKKSGKSVNEIAGLHKITPTMVRIILGNKKTK